MKKLLLALAVLLPSPLLALEMKQTLIVRDELGGKLREAEVSYLLSHNGLEKTILVKVHSADVGDSATNEEISEFAHKMARRMAASWAQALDNPAALPVKKTEIKDRGVSL